MRAWICSAWGGPEDLRLGVLPEPLCGPGEVAIEPQAWGVNFADLVLIAGRYQARPAFPFAPGMEVAGRVSATGAGVAGLAVGDHVAAYVEYGGYAERVVAPGANVARLPAAIDMPAAAAFPVPYGTAALALERAALVAGETVLVGGAAGAVGLACVALAKLRGARVVACVGSDDKARAVREQGADAVVSSRSARLRDELREAVPAGFDVVFDPVGGAFHETALRCLRFAGRLVSLGFASGEIPQAPVNQILVRHLSVIGSSFGLACKQEPARVAARWPGLVELLAAGRIRPLIDRTVSFAALPEALGLLRDRQVAGRVVLLG